MLFLLIQKSLRVGLLLTRAEMTKVAECLKAQTVSNSLIVLCLMLLQAATACQLQTACQHRMLMKLVHWLLLVMNVTMIKAGMSEAVLADDRS